VAVGRENRQGRFDDVMLLVGDQLPAGSIYRLLPEHGGALVGMRNRLRASDRPRRLFEEVNTTARAAGLLRGRRRVLDSTPLLDAVATQDTVIQVRAAIRKLLAVADSADPELAGAVRTALTRDDDYASLGKPPCDWDDPKAREALVDDASVRDANAALDACDGRELDGTLGGAAELLALVAGQDVEAGDDGVFRIARRVARDRLISTIDTGARHGHKSVSCVGHIGVLCGEEFVAGDRGGELEEGEEILALALVADG
jgi:hypothetical protein